MGNLFELENLYQNTWVVLDGTLQVIDSGENIRALRGKHSGVCRRTFCYVPGAL